MKKQLGIISGLILLILANTQTARANLIVNGSFEDGDYSGNNGSWERLGPGDLRLTGWTIGGDGVDWHNGAEFQPIDGKAIDLNLDGISHSFFSQTFSTIPGKWYSLTFSMAAPGFFHNGDRLVRVDVAGQQETFSVPETNNMALDWEINSMNFQASSTETTLKFSGGFNGGFWGPVLNNVVVTPEPVSTVLLGLGGAALALSRRRQKA